MKKLIPLLITLSFASFVYAERDLTKLRVLNGEYPAVFFFRNSEGAPSRKGAKWDDWDREYSRLMGIMGKCLDEEVLGREANNPEWFTRFKEKNPEQSVLLHFNGNARDPRHGTDKYFHGHWVYRQAVGIVADIPATSGESEIKVESVSDFKVNTGRYKTSSDDIALFGITDDGRHDWNHCEQVQLISVDSKQNTIKVKRGCYGTKPLAFMAGRSRAAAHAVEGPWGKHNNLMWFYNFATHSPRDAEGKSCADRLVDDLAMWFGKGGKLEKFDGLEFDVLHNVTHGDTTGDGVMDNGFFDGINAYGSGVYAFAGQLRQRLGRDLIIQADGALGQGGERSQRANGILNGIESEGWPNLKDWNFDDWSGGINRHNFWHANAFKPAFSYINHKWIEPVPDKPGMTRHPVVPFSRHRLAFAGAQFTDAVLTYSFAPPHERGKPIGIWDELNCGMDNKLGWLGQPLDATICLARESPDLLNGAGAPAGELLVSRVVGDVKVESIDKGLLISSVNPARKSLVFQIQGVPVPLESSELTVFVNMSARARKGYPAEMPRFSRVAVSGGCIDLMSGGDHAISRGMCLRGGSEQDLNVSATGGNLHYQRSASVGGESMSAFALHPPYKGKKGYVFWSRDITIPARSYDLHFNLGMSAKAPQRSDGIWYKVFVAEVSGERVGDYRKIFEKSTKAHAWVPCSVSLQEWSGKKVRIKFVADCGPKNNATTDQGFWSGVRLKESGLAEAAITPEKSYMTWLNSQPFEASFYYRNIRSEQVDLTFTIEGSEPVLLTRLIAHAAADARCRTFENGVVLGNPSLEPYTFDLSIVACDRTLHRIKASAMQDGEVNNGEVVGATVTLGPLDGLFLVEE
ncbi:MAG: hypothetical protein PF904_12395 [Kiritimatiellae bacterium]|jgi:hypothetical protein|nr:hypothetical protein [Kiritimatiellia bacterium]